MINWKKKYLKYKLKYKKIQGGDRSWFTGVTAATYTLEYWKQNTILKDDDLYHVIPEVYKNFLNVREANRILSIQNNIYESTENNNNDNINRNLNLLHFNYNKLYNKSVNINKINSQIYDYDLIKKLCYGLFNHIGIFDKILFKWKNSNNINAMKLLANIIRLYIYGEIGNKNGSSKQVEIINEFCKNLSEILEASGNNTFKITILNKSTDLVVGKQNQAGRYICLNENWTFQNSNIEHFLLICNADANSNPAIECGDCW